MSRFSLANLGYHRRRLSLCALTGVTLFGPSAIAQTPDFTVANLQVVQTIQTGTTLLVGRKSTMVRATLKIANGTTSSVPVDGLMRVYVSGQEIPDSPFYSNGPIAVKSSPDANFENDTLNFVFLPPTSNSVTIEVEVNPAGASFVPEQNVGNNKLSTPNLYFLCKGSPEIAYVPIDYRPTGGGTNLPDAAMIEPGVGDNFVQAAFPTADVNYHRTDAPSKLWTLSVDDSSGASALINSMWADYAMMSPQPDFLYGWIPGSLPYNGISQNSGWIAFGNTVASRYQRTFCHELGHNFGLIHNSFNVGTVGVDVEHHLHLTQALNKLKQSGLYDVMVAGKNTYEAWVHGQTYNYIANEPELACSSLFSAPLAGSGLLISGTWDRSGGSATLSDVVQLPSVKLTQGVPLHQAELIVRSHTASGLQSTVGFLSHGNLGDCDSDTDAPMQFVGFGVIVEPTLHGEPIDRIEILDASNQATMVSLARSAHAPTATFLSPRLDAPVSNSFTVSYQGSDVDGDAIRYYLRYSPNGGERVIPLATNTTQTSLDVDLTTMPPLIPGQGYFELFASDGLNTTQIRSLPIGPPSIALSGGGASGGAPPLTHLYTPDSGKTFPKGATVVLHAAAFDFEDRLLDNGSVTWSSNIDGIIGNGRLTSVKDLSVGTHVITVRSFDSGSQSSSAVTTITVTDRPLPGSPTIVCQTDLGFGAAGTAKLSFCGGDLSSGTSADLELAGAPSHQPGWIVVSDTLNPILFSVGTFVTLPVVGAAAIMTDASGNYSLPNVAGGGGPKTFYAQVVYGDPALPLGVGLSNALKIDFLP